MASRAAASAQRPVPVGRALALLTFAATTVCTISATNSLPDLPRQASHHAGLTGSASLTFFPPLEKLPTPEPPDPNLSITPTPPLANAIDAATPGLKKAPEAEVADILAEMLGHIRRGDWAKYAKMCDPEMTCIEPESQNMRVSGLPFHQVSIFCPPASAQAYAVPSQQWTEEQPTQASFD